eukprot:GFKZ01001865.1.p1 GENE.GFKZ01001865.1~~GFKZ01001865.1.p1  ORF type:complete len:120 (+),score=4.68 GFKZ01001865.1:79-438(+)
MHEGIRQELGGNNKSASENSRFLVIICKQSHRTPRGTHSNNRYNVQPGHQQERCCCLQCAARLKKAFLAVHVVGSRAKNSAQPSGSPSTQRGASEFCFLCTATLFQSRSSFDPYSSNSS